MVKHNCIVLIRSGNFKSYFNHINLYFLSLLIIHSHLYIKEVVFMFETI